MQPEDFALGPAQAGKRASERAGDQASQGNDRAKQTAAQAKRSAGKANEKRVNIVICLHRIPHRRAWAKEQPAGRRSSRRPAPRCYARNSPWPRVRGCRIHGMLYYSINGHVPNPTPSVHSPARGLLFRSTDALFLPWGRHGRSCCSECASRCHGRGGSCHRYDASSSSSSKEAALRALGRAGASGWSQRDSGRLTLRAARRRPRHDRAFNELVSCGQPAQPLAPCATRRALAPLRRSSASHVRRSRSASI